MDNLIAVLTTAWGAQHGGINAFNADYCVALSKQLRGIADVICVAPYADLQHINEAGLLGVTLLSLDSANNEKYEFEEHRADQVIRQLYEQYNKKPDWWIGHDVKTGPVAIACANICPGSKCAIFHHMDYSAYKAMGAENTEKEVTLQRSVLSRANIIFAVGPKLFDSAISITAGSDIVVRKIIPGLPEIKAVPIKPRFSAIAFGRIEPENDRVKQAKLAVAAFGRAHRDGSSVFENDDSIILIGLSSDETKRASQQNDLNRIAFDQAGRVVQVHGWPYMENRSELFEHLRNASVCLMLSIHEGYGLTGWEAIAAEVPLIVSENSGVYKAIGGILGGMGLGCITKVNIRGDIGENTFQEQDVVDVANALIATRKNYSQRKVDAANLRKLLSHVCTWEDAADSTISCMGLASEIESANTNALAMLGVDRWQPKFLLDLLTRSKNEIVDEASRRKRMFEHIWQGIRSPASVKQRVILFGGVASSLCTDEAAKRFECWLKENLDAQLFVCYETGNAAQERARQLSKEKLIDDGGLPTDPKSRMDAKTEKILGLKKLISSFSHGDSMRSVESRIHYIPINHPLTNYIICLDDDIFITPLFEMRSTETLTFMLSKRAGEFHSDILRYMQHHLRICKADQVYDTDGMLCLENTLEKMLTRR